ncbi:MAG: hypothetical protein K8U57_28390 [Planctomycetes bacterium]|nr:hypothetical protein [Planctomycetota bacterium]
MQSLQEVVGAALSYCGLPSVEFLDVVCWKGIISSVAAFENDPDALPDMHIERDRLQFKFPVLINPKGINNVLDYLASEQYCYGLYNIDLFGGLVYQNKYKESKTASALRQLFSQQAKGRRSFVLISTFNVRDAGADEYNEFLDSVRDGLSGRPQSKENIKAHDENQATRLKLCFPFFCWQQAHALGLEQIVCEATYYKSSAFMIHFFQAFRYVGGVLPQFAPVSKVIEVANEPLYEMVGQVRRKMREFPQVL